MHFESFTHLPKYRLKHVPEKVFCSVLQNFSFSNIVLPSLNYISHERKFFSKNPKDFLP